MTRLLFLPTEHTLLWLEEPRAAGQLVEEVRAGRWLPPPPYAACLPEHPDW
ncbi:MAG: hypothetical protein GYA17_05340, partial [Chloroflexi bacterium]|nr:hypothetical protein [Chloroflexota bacterium]